MPCRAAYLQEKNLFLQPNLNKEMIIYVLAVLHM